MGRFATRGLWVAAVLLLGAEIASAANMCYTSNTIIPTKNRCKDLAVTPRFCAATEAAGNQLATEAAAYLDGEAITTAACGAWYDAREREFLIDNLLVRVYFISGPASRAMGV
jgi:hypothetical protein